MWEMEGLVDSSFRLVRQISDGVVEEVVEEVLTEVVLDVVFEGVGVVEDVVPGGMAFDCLVCWSEEGGLVEFVEGGDETGALEETEEVIVVWVGGESVDEGGGDGDREWLLDDASEEGQPSTEHRRRE
jgi:hypothetical protein